jgi:Rrf2 family protein
MRISKRTRYGVRLILELALHYGKKPLSVSQIAELEGISPKFLGQIIIPLKSAGLIQSTRGAQGGYELAQSPAQVSVLDVFRVLEGDCFLTECIKNPAECLRSGMCVTKHIWNDLSAVVEDKLSNLKFSELVEQARALAERQAPVYQI